MKKATAKSEKVIPNFSRRPDRDRRIRQNERIARVLKILGLLQSRARWNAKSIAEELSCSERTVYRDLEVLAFAGVPWYFEEAANCYKLRADYRFPALALNEEEAIGQVVATAFTKAPGVGIGNGAVAMTRKLVQASSDTVEQIVTDASHLMHVLDMKFADHSKHQGILQLAQQALLHRRRLIGHYESPYESSPVKLNLIPFRLCLIKQAWYLIGMNQGDTAPKTFRIARFKSLRIAEQIAEVPQEFDLHEYFGNAWAVHRGEERFSVKLRFNRRVSKVVTETLWHSTQKATRNRDGSVTLSFEVDGLDEIANWVMRWSGSVIIVEPIELKQRIVQRWILALAQNDNAST